jgi:hypothetical protein
LFTCVEEADARELLDRLARCGYVPLEFLGRLEYIEWSGEKKDLCLVPDAVPWEVLLVDGDPGWILPEQRDRWVAIAAWAGGEDSELLRVQSVLECWFDDDEG